MTLAESDGFNVVPPSQDCPFAAINFAAQLGPSLAVVAPDSRSQRSQTQILSDGTYKWLIKAVCTCRFTTIVLKLPMQSGTTDWNMHMHAKSICITIHCFALVLGTHSMHYLTLMWVHRSTCMD